MRKMDDSVFEAAKSLFLRYAAPLELEKRYPGQGVPERLVVAELMDEVLRRAVAYQQAKHMIPYPAHT